MGHDSISIPGYRILEQIDETDHSIIYRALAEDKHVNVIIKALRARFPSPAEVARLKHEYELIRSLDIEGVIKVYDIIDHDLEVTLVLEDFGGIPLKVLIAGGFTLDRFLELAMRLANILGHLHHQGVTHRDIKPGNILLNLKDNILKLTDFGIASEYTRENEEIYNPSVMEGTLAYISPEQTGRVNCAVDYRTDLYSLGVTFYEMLTGKVPFQSDDPMEIIHAHIAKVPVRPEKFNRDVPGIVSDIVMKLMSKVPTERYQNCFGLVADLWECLQALHTTGRIEPFELGRQDIALRFIIPQLLVGRDDELKLLQGAFDRVSEGGVEVMLITGEPGIGKSALVGEIHKPIVEKHGYFIAGKYDQFRRSVPYSAIIQAFQVLARQLLTENEERIVEWKEKILSVLGPNGKIITDAIPEIELIIGKQPDVPELGPEETQNRFNLFFKNFVRVFADQAHPLVLFLDDLQWADSASLNLIQTMTADRYQSFFLCIGAYRDTEVAAHHPLMLALDAMRGNSVLISTAALGPLKPEDVNQFIAYFLRCTPKSALSLADIIYAKTKGNPFFVNQFLKTLYDDHHITLDPGRGWTWNMKHIEELQVTDNVVEFMAAKLRDLPAKPLKLIQICACIGNHFDLETLGSITAYPIDDILSLMDTLVQEGFINRKGDFYRFHHDRIHEAAYSLLTPAEREQMHFRIGTLDFERTPADQFFNRIFYIVDQLNQGCGLISSQTERNRLADLNLKAGNKAKESTAYAAAVIYLTAGIELLAPDTWQSQYRLTYDLYKELMECHYLNRDFAEAERLFEIIIAHATTKIDKARAYNTMVVLYTNTRSPRKAIELGLTALKMFGINLSIDAGKGPVILALIKAKIGIKKLSLEKILDLPCSQDEEILAIHELMLNIGTPAYYVNPNLFALLVLKGVNDSIKYGHLPHTAIAYIGLAVIVEAAGDYNLGYRIGEMALKLNERLDNRKIAGPLNHTFAFLIQHWKKHVKFDLAFYPKVYELSINTGNFIYAGHSITAAAETSIRISKSLDDVLDGLKKYQEFMNIMKDPLITGQYQLLIRWIMALKGLTLDRHDLSEDGINLSTSIEQFRKEGNIFGLCFALYAKIILSSWYGRYEKALEAAAELDKHIHVPIGTLLVADHYFHYSLILTALLQQGESRRKKKFNAIIRRNQRKMLRWAKLCPKNFRHKYDFVAAEMMAIKGRKLEALALYHAAIEGARRNEYLQEEAIICERLALFYLGISAKEEAKLFMQHAYRCYVSWGASGKVKELEERYAPLIPIEQKQHAIGTVTKTSTKTTTSSSILDLSTVMQVSQLISSEIMLDRLLQKTMHISIANAGAQRGYLILESDGELTIEASEDVDNSETRVMQSMALQECPDLCLAIVNYVHRSGKDVILDNAVQKGPFMNDPYIKRTRCKSILCAPILNKGKFSGILYMENNLSENAFTPERLELLHVLTAQAAISIENARLFELATTDGLTKLCVHRYFQLLLDREIQRSRRYNKHFALIMIDIDNFKTFNDTYGHQLGDEVLKSVARAIRKTSRAEDVVARYGGEEFVMILPETDTQQAMCAAEMTRTVVETVEIMHGEERLHVTISLGVSTFPIHAREKEDLIRCADEAMYAAKRGGKNQVSLAVKLSEPLEQGMPLNV